MLVYLDEESAKGLRDILSKIIDQINEGLKDYERN